MNAKIEFQDFYLNKVVSVKIQSSWRELTDKATIVLPRSLKFKNQSLKDVFKTGDNVKIYLGYNGNYNLEFDGYITKISSDSPFTLECQDKMYELKKIKVNKSYAKANLKQVIADLLPPDYKSDVADIELGGLILSKTTLAKALQVLKDKFKIYSYFKGDTLVAGKIYTDDDNTVVYELEKNVFRNNLKFRNKDDVKLKVTAKSFLPDGKILKASVGDTDAPETETVHYNITSETKLKKLARQDYERMIIDGYEGDIVTYGEPYARHGWRADIRSAQYPERNGLYFIDAVNTDFSKNGFRRTLKIGKRAG